MYHECCEWLNYLILNLSDDGTTGFFLLAVSLTNNNSNNLFHSVAIDEKQLITPCAAGYLTNETIASWVTANDVIKACTYKKKITRILLKKHTSTMVSLLKKSKKGALNSQKELLKSHGRASSG